MLYKEYGKTGKKLSVIGFGGMRFKREANGKYDRHKCAELVIKANELGINYFDTGPYYCGGKSEDIFGLAFKNMPSEYFISTKSGEITSDGLRWDLERSLKKLGIPKIHFYNLWSILTLDDYKKRMAKGGAYEAALKAKEEGLIEHIVFSTHCNGGEIEAIIKECCFEGVTLGYNILNFPYRQQGIKAAYEHNIGAITMNPLGGGVIPGNAELFDFLRSDSEHSVVQAALTFNISHKEITTALTGISTVEELIENVAFVNGMKQFPESKLKEIEGKLIKYMDSLCTGCRYCEPCPKDIPISKYMMTYDKKTLAGLHEGIHWLKWQWVIPKEKSANCIACGKCEKKCTQHLPIIERLKEISTWKEGD